MRVPLSWLRDYVDLPMAADELAEALTLRGMEVSSVEVVGGGWSDVVVGRLLAVERHPNADTLWLARVDTGAGEPLEIVCGAGNIAPGQLVPVAVPGAVLPGDRRIERTKIRGAVSQGMLCSSVELGLGTDADGILVLGTGDEHPLGTPLEAVVGETVLDVDVKPNRGDALSMVGLAREIAALTGGALRMPPTAVDERGAPAAEATSVRVEAPDLCPRFVGRLFTHVANGPSPDWMQRRLVAAGMRPISAVVDVTNYVMHELGQPMHAYDADAVPGGEIVVRRAADGERLTTIDHVERRLDPRMLVIADRAAPIGIAGIMGGAGTEVGEATTRVILESAIFHGPSVRSTARRLGLRSEASMRHEKGLHHDLPRLAADRAAGLLAELTGAHVAAGFVDSRPDPPPSRRIAVDLRRAERLVGISIDASRADELLRPLGFGVETGGEGTVEVAVPEHRLDVVEAADVAEELARAHGYQAIPGRELKPSLPAYRPDPTGPVHRARRILAGLGLDEVVSHALIGAADLARSGYPADGEHLVRIANPLSEEHAILRPVLYPSLHAALAENARQRRNDAWIFEVGKVYWFHPGTPTPRERAALTAGTGRFESAELGIGLMGAPAGRGVGEPPRAADVADLKGVIDALHDALGAPRPVYRAADPSDGHPHRHPGRTGLVCDAAGRPYGSLGELHPRIAAAWGLPGRPLDAALSLDALLGLAPEVVRAAPIPTAQPIDRDLAVAVDATTPVGDLLRVARQAAGPLLAELELFDAYRGAQVGEGRVSYALALRFQPQAAGDERAVEKALNKVRGALTHHLGAEIRA